MSTRTQTHTAGPWITDGKFIKCIDHAKYYAVARASNPLFTKEGNEANARLIAAAPDLLHALKKCLTTFEEHTVAGERLSDHYAVRISQARAAIAKATSNP